jgi:hypothetical protein
MRILAGLFALSTILACAIPPAEAAQPPRVAAYDCRQLAAQKGPANVWQTWFTGRRDNLFGPDDWYTASPCFASLTNCKAWLYWAQSDWPKVNTFRPCRKGVGY